MRDIAHPLTSAPYGRETRYAARTLAAQFVDRAHRPPQVATATAPSALPPAERTTPGPPIGTGPPRSRPACRAPAARADAAGSSPAPRRAEQLPGAAGDHAPGHLPPVPVLQLLGQPIRRSRVSSRNAESVPASAAARSASVASPPPAAGQRAHDQDLVPVDHDLGRPVNQSSGSAPPIQATASSVGGGSPCAPPRPRPHLARTSPSPLTPLQCLQHYTVSGRADPPRANAVRCKLAHDAYYCRRGSSARSASRTLRAGAGRAGIRGRSGVPRVGVEAQSTRERRYAPPAEPPVPGLVPIWRSAISTCRARHSDQAWSWSTRASARSQSGPYCARSWAIVRSDSRRSSSVVGGEAGWAAAGRGTRPTATARPAAAAARPAPSGTRPRSRSRYAGSFRPDRNSISRNCADWNPDAGASLVRKRQEVLRRHGVDHVDLGDQDPLDGVAALQPYPGQVGLAGQHPVPGVGELGQQQLEPQLVDLVDGDEQQLVVGRRVRLGHLLRQQLRHAQVAAVREQPALLAERRHPAKIRPAPVRPRRDGRRRVPPGSRRRARPDPPRWRVRSAATRSRSTPRPRSRPGRRARCPAGPGSARG